ncbi:MAG: C-terminal binding protein [Pseudomonadota bacterium]
MRVLYADHTDALVTSEFDRLRAAGIDPVLADPQCREEGQVLGPGADADAIVCAFAPMTRAVLQELPNLKLICTPQAGTDHIDLDAARELGICVAHTPLANHHEVATHALTLILMLIRGIPEHQAHTRHGGWDFKAAGALQRTSDLALGLVGAGRIAQTLASFADGLFGRIFAYDPFVAEADWPAYIERVESLDDLLAQADAVSLHVPLNDTTTGFADAGFFARMKPDSFLVNVSRGGLVHSSALIAAVDREHVRGAALDVLETEPPLPDSPVLQHPRIVVTPHAAFYSLKSQEDQRVATTDNLIAFSHTGKPSFPCPGF